MDLGFERAGFEVGLAYDIRAHSIASWNRNRAGAVRGHVADLVSIRLRDMDRHHGGRFIPSGVIGGPPCQSFSRANHLRSDGDPRGKLVRHFFSIALRFHRNRSPLDFVLMENVPDLVKAEHGRLLQKEIRRLEEHGLRVHTFCLDAVGHDVPQRRRRLFLLAVREQECGLRRWSTPIGRGTEKTVREAIGGLPQPALFRQGLTTDEISGHPNHWCMTPKSRRFFDGSLKPGYSAGRSFKTLAWDAPSFAVSYGHREVHVHPEGRRRLSVFEAMRLQGFPDDYVLEGTLSAQIDQVSEAVPPPLAEAVAGSVVTLLGNNVRPRMQEYNSRTEDCPAVPLGIPHS